MDTFKFPHIPQMNMERQAVVTGERGLFEARNKLLPIDVLRWDTQMRYGQTYALDPRRVYKLMESFATTPLTEPVGVLVWHDGGMSTKCELPLPKNHFYLASNYWVIAAQNVSKAVRDAAMVYEEEVLSGMPWMRHVRADILKPSVNLYKR